MEAENFIREQLKLEDPKRFELKERQFQKQFCGIYRARLTALKTDLVLKATEKWKNIEIVTLTDLTQRDSKDPCIIIGTLYKHQELKPSILHELSDELQVQFQPIRANYASFKDYILLEDECLSIKLVGDCLKPQDIVTGVVCAVIGYLTNLGVFQAIDHCFPGFYINKQLGRKKVINSPEPEQNFSGKIVLVSSLNSGTAELLSLNLLAEWISGLAGDVQAQKAQSSIVCVIIAGNSTKNCPTMSSHLGYASERAHDKALLKQSAASAERLDKYLSFIAQTCPVILMPGEFDPTGHCLPQQPFHPCILPRCARLKSVHCVSNPWMAYLNSRLVSGSSGQAIRDILRVNSLSQRTPLSVLEDTLSWRHYAPTAPDTVPVYPFEGKDPFVIKEHLDVYFTGNMEEFETKLVEENGQKTRLVCIPNFSSTQTAVVVDLEDLNCWTVSFG